MLMLLRLLLAALLLTTAPALAADLLGQVSAFRMATP
jgi:hypothetical protein